MNNGWLPLSKAIPMGYAHYYDDKNPTRVLLWIRGHGITDGIIYTTQDGLVIQNSVQYPNQHVVAWQPALNGPYSRNARIAPANLAGRPAKRTLSGSKGKKPTPSGP